MHNNAAAIEVLHVARKFRRGERRRPLREAINRLFTRGALAAKQGELRSDEFWAIEDLSFSVSRGEALAIIGPNGAGKSTALKLLARIMPPSRGEIRTNGRVSALIEVGAGFHPDLTGRENVYLNAAVLGLSRAETRKRFDEIVEFAGIGEFLDTPLKRYSSGMHARLGFAVAAHVEPDVLLVDEVLSVGDRVFRAKCMERMRAFLRRGVAIVFVSHDLTAVTSFCDRAIVLDRGRTVFNGAAAEAVQHYHQACVPARQAGAPNGAAARVGLCHIDGTPGRSFAPRERMRIEYEISATAADEAPWVRIIRLRDSMAAFAGAIETDGGATGGDVRGQIELSLNIPPAEYAVQVASAPRGADPNRIAWGGDARMMVRGAVTSGGIVEVAPRFEVVAV